MSVVERVERVELVERVERVEPVVPVVRELVLATRNVGKAAELRALLAPLGARVLSLDDAGIAPDPDEERVEDGATFEENAIAKARYFAARTGGRPVIADDSGLCVTALDGAPGVRSRRWAGATGSEADVSRANSAHLLVALRDVTDRGAAFVCAVAYSDGATEIVARGETTGRILDAPLGTQGFGYDPLFWSDELGRGFGEATRDEKAHVSHRARGVMQLIETLRRATKRQVSAVDDTVGETYTPRTSGA